LIKTNDIIKTLILDKKSQFYYRYKHVCPNVSWGLGLHHECDLLVATKQGVGHEIEIKVSLQDLKRDLEKYHRHRSTKIKYLWFAAPEDIIGKGIQFIPEHAGIISVFYKYQTLKFEILRKPKGDKFARNLTQTELNKLDHLTTMRFWKLWKMKIKYKKNGVGIVVRMD